MTFDFSKDYRKTPPHLAITSAVQISINTHMPAQAPCDGQIGPTHRFQLKFKRKKISSFVLPFGYGTSHLL